MKRLQYSIMSARFLAVLIMLAATGLFAAAVGAQKSAPKSTFRASLTDASGSTMTVDNLRFYWEEKLSETAFVPHELTHVPVKRGESTINVKFGKIRRIELASNSKESPPVLQIELTNGNTGEFPVAIPGKFKGESDFGEVEVEVGNIREIEFK